MGLLIHVPRPGRPSLEQDGSTASEAVDTHEMSLVYCRRCVAWVDRSDTRLLSTHPTSGGLVTYFRCPAGHADFCQTPAQAPRWRASKPHADLMAPRQGGRNGTRPPLVGEHP